MVPRNQVFLHRDDQTQTQFYPSISVCAQKTQVVLSNLNSAQETTDWIPEIASSSDIIVPVEGNTGEMFNEGDLQILRTTPWGQDATPNNVDYTGEEDFKLFDESFGQVSSPYKEVRHV